jgi:holo-[acyl-carrier protein] synthase
MIRGIGVDLVDLRRIHEHLVSRVLSPSEQQELALLTDPVVRQQFIGTRFAAKEALYKATQTSLTMAEVTVAHRPSGEPYFVEYPTIHLSISHEKEYAIAFVVADNM